MFEAAETGSLVAGSVASGNREAVFNRAGSLTMRVLVSGNAILISAVVDQILGSTTGNISGHRDGHLAGRWNARTIPAKAGDVD